MRKAVLLLLLLLSGCALYRKIVGEEEGKAPPPAESETAVEAPITPEPEAGAEDCFDRLDRISGLKYRRLPPRKEGVCGYDDAVQLLDIGVPIPGLGPISCPAAESLYQWVHKDVLPAARKRLGSRVVRISSFGTYACHSPDRQAAASPSEHARANAVDIAAFTLANGRTVTVEDGWGGRQDAQAFLRAVHKAGCSKFHTVIGPEDDRFHQDHIHLDMGEGSYCK